MRFGERTHRGEEAVVIEENEKTLISLAISRTEQNDSGQKNFFVSNQSFIKPRESVAAFLKES